MLGVQPGYLELSSFGPLTLDPSFLLSASVSLDANGDGSWTIAVPATISGVNLFFQEFSTAGLSNAMTVQF